MSGDGGLAHHGSVGCICVGIGVVEAGVGSTAWQGITKPAEELTVIDLDMIAQVSAGEGAAYAVGGSVFTLIASLLIKHGFRVVVGGNGATNGKGAKSQYCPSHDEFSRKLDERQAVLKAALCGITRNQESQQKLLVNLSAAVRASAEQVKSLAGDVSDVKQAISRLHDRVDHGINGTRYGHEHEK